MSLLSTYVVVPNSVKRLSKYAAIIIRINFSKGLKIDLNASVLEDNRNLPLRLKIRLHLNLLSLPYKNSCISYQIYTINTVEKMNDSMKVVSELNRNVLKKSINFAIT